VGVAPQSTNRLTSAMSRHNVSAMSRDMTPRLSRRDRDMNARRTPNTTPG
jgi:hypothetical protein